jgi:hypothetical protein
VPKQEQKAARKVLAHTPLWIFVALLIGAFCASFAGSEGGNAIAL